MRRTRKLRTAPATRAEDDIWERIQKSTSRVVIAKRRLPLGIGDDAALFLPTPNHETILTCDWFLEGTHFLRDKHPPDAVGWKCLARATSDIAAMGGLPRCFLLSLALPATHSGRWLAEFLGGLRRASRQFQCVLAGGDTTRRQDILINVTVVGEVRSGDALLRARASPGDVLFVSGRLGEAELGLRMIRQSSRWVNSRNPVLRKHLYPQPRIALGSWLAYKHLVSAMMDLSDGLSTDLPRLCRASGVGAHIQAERIPSVRVPGRTVKDANPLDLALHGGDDYELLFTVPRKKLNQLPHSFHGIRLTPIGEITGERHVLLVNRSGEESPLPNRGWDPFRKST